MPIRTDADHGPQRHRVQDATRGTPITRLALDAWIPADSVEARPLRRTVRVDPALRSRHGDTPRIRIPRVTGWAPTDRPVIHHPALRSFGARIPIDARVHALSVDAGERQGTVPVRPTSDESAGSPAVSFVSRQASALGAVSLRVTFGVRGARVVHETRVDAVAVVAGAVVGAVVVRAASDWTVKVDVRPKQF